MDCITRSTLAGFVALLAALLLFIVPARADFAVPYCSSQNTATNFDAMDSQWQSNGWCHDKCNSLGSYAFAVIQYRNCWCSNYIPEAQEDTGDCDQDCPGFPSEKCGNADKGLYIYVEVDGKPSGTQGTSTPTSANSASSSDPPSTTATPTTLATHASDQTSAAEPQTSVMIVTESGRVITQTVVSTPSSGPVQSGNQKKGTNAGAIAGGVVGGIAVIAAAVGGVFFLLWRRRKQQQDDDEGTSGVQRNTSTLSKSGLLRGEKGPQYPPPIATSFNKRQSRTMLDSESISPISGSDRRNSRPFVFDQRLNPSAIMFNDNSSRASVGTLDDSRDYARTLNVRNPDVNPEQQ